MSCLGLVNHKMTSCGWVTHYMIHHNWSWIYKRKKFVIPLQHTQTLFKELVLYINYSWIQIGSGWKQNNCFNKKNVFLSVQSQRITVKGNFRETLVYGLLSTSKCNCQFCFDFRPEPLFFTFRETRKTKCFIFLV